MASIRERTTKAGTSTWNVVYRDENQVQTSHTFADGKSAQRFRQAVEVFGPEKAVAELLAPQFDDRITVAELADKFLAWKETGPRKVTARTLTDYKRDYRNWIKPVFGHRAAETLDEADVQDWVDAMTGKLSAKSVADRHMLLHSMYEYGRARTRRQLVPHNPCKETELPQRTKKPPKGSTVSEWRAVLEAAEKRNPDARDLIEYLGVTGWRWSEGAALAVRNVFDDGAMIYVDMDDVFRIDGQGRQYLAEDEAKSDAGFRRTPIVTASARAMLRRRVVGKGPGELVFTNSRGRHWNQNTFLRETWPRITRDARLERHITPHWLRHMAVGVLSAAGVPVQEIQRIIGHEHIETTIGTYGRMIGGAITAESMHRAEEILAGRGPAGAVVVGELVEAKVLEVTG